MPDRALSGGNDAADLVKATQVPAGRDPTRRVPVFSLSLSIRDVEELMLQRGIQVSREAVRCWVNKFGPLIASNLRRRRSPPTGRWHLDEMVVNIAGRRMYLWRAVDDEGEVLDVLVQMRRNAAAAIKLLRTLLKNQGATPELITTDIPPLSPDPAHPGRRGVDCCDRSRLNPGTSGLSCAVALNLSEPQSKCGTFGLRRLNSSAPLRVLPLKAARLEELDWALAT